MLQVGAQNHSATVCPANCVKSIVPPPTIGAENWGAAGAAAFGAAADGLVAPVVAPVGESLVESLAAAVAGELALSAVLQATPPVSAQPASAKVASENRDRFMVPGQYSRCLYF